MGYYKKWRPSKSEKVAFSNKMNEIEEFCSENGIKSSKNSDSYYFELDGQEYRVSNHTVWQSNEGAYDEFGTQTRALYHPDGEEEDCIYFTAGKTRIIEIYNDLKAGYELTRRGYRITEKAS